MDSVNLSTSYYPYEYEFAQGDLAGAEEGHFSPSEGIAAAKIGVVDFSILILMWLIIFATSIKSFGQIPRVLFLILNVVLVVRKPENGILVLLLHIFTPSFALLIPRNFVVSFVIASLGCLIHGRLSRLGKLISAKIFIVAVLFVVWAGLSILNSPDLTVAKGYYSRYIDAIIAISLFILLVGSREELGRVFKWWAIVAALSIFIAVVHVVLGANTFAYAMQEHVFSVLGTTRAEKLLVGVGRGITKRLLWPGLGANFHSATLIFSLGLALAFYSVTKLKQKIFWLVITLIIAVAIVGTFSRSGFIAACITVALFLIRKNIKAVIPVGIIGGFGIILLKFLPLLSERVVTIGQVTAQGASGRFALWTSAIGMWISSPILGHGIGSYFVNKGHAVHNTYLEILTEMGVIGLVLYLMLIFLSFKACLSTKNAYPALGTKDYDFSQILIIALTGMCLMVGTLTYYEVKLFWMVLVGCYMMSSLIQAELTQIQYIKDDSDNFCSCL